MHDEGYVEVTAWSSDPDFSADEDGVIEETRYPSIPYNEKITFGPDELLNLTKLDDARRCLEVAKTCRVWFSEHRGERIGNLVKSYIFCADGGSRFRAKELVERGIFPAGSSWHIDVGAHLAAVTSHERALEKLVAWMDEMRMLYGDRVFFQVKTW